MLNGTTHTTPSGARKRAAIKPVKKKRRGRGVAVNLVHEALQRWYANTDRAPTFVDLQKWSGLDSAGGVGSALAILKRRGLVIGGRGEWRLPVKAPPPPVAAVAPSTARAQLEKLRDQLLARLAAIDTVLAELP